MQKRKHVASVKTTQCKFVLNYTRLLYPNLYGWKDKA